MSWSRFNKRIADVCEVIAGQSPEGKYYNKIGRGLPFYQGKKEFTEKVLGEPTTWTTKVTKEAIANDILMSVRAPVGPINVATQKICIGRGLAAIRASEEVNNDYLFYYLLKHESEIVGNIGAVFNSINKSQIGNIQIPIPPLEEQKQIVVILDKAFAAIDQAKANIEKNMENAKELFESKKEEIFDKLSLENEVKSIEDACDKIFAGGDAPKDNFSKEKTKEFNIPIIANAVKENGLYGYTNEARVTEPSITVAARGSGTGHTEYRDYPYVPIVRLIVLIPNTDVINVEFLMHAIKTLTILRSGSAIPQLTVPMIKSYSIPLPKLDKQLQIIEILNDLELQLSKYQCSLDEKLNNLEDLKKSILQKAFAGELTYNKDIIPLKQVAEPMATYSKK
ncbi:MAG: restriction endonuclease subunit S [Flavobacteriaceae bacterium]|nr:restriction endonuclease subunit S [Flavobacteriaceae bacterium]